MLTTLRPPERETTMDLQPQPAFAGASPSRATDARKLVRARLAAKRRRARHIRQAVVAFTMAVFVALFATIYVQLASGHDPALSASRKAAATRTSATSQQATTVASAASEGGSSNSSATNSSSAGSSEPSSTEASSTPATVTTRQS
jgi:hypothetical protein